MERVQLTTLNYCPFCGEPLAAEGTFCPYCGESLPRGTMDGAYHEIDSYLSSRKNQVQSTFRSIPIFSLDENPAACFSNTETSVQITTSEAVAFFDSLLDFMTPFVRKYSESMYRDIYHIAVRFRKAFGKRKVVSLANDEEADALEYVLLFLLFSKDSLEGKKEYALVVSTLDGFIRTVYRICPSLGSQESVKGKTRSKGSISYDDEIQEQIKQLTDSLNNEAPQFKCEPYVEGYPYAEKLNALIGLTSVKTKLKEQITAYDYQVARRRMHPELGIESSFHCLFKGNPGTGKTTVARILGGLFRSKGLLRSGHCVEVNAADLITGFVGMGGRMARLAALKAMGGVLFIDEAYALRNSKGIRSDAGAEVMDELTKMMEDYRDRFIVILAGYEKEMDDFISHSNTGLKSRFKCTLHFEDYNADELYQIFKKLVADNRFKMETEADTQARILFRRVSDSASRMTGFANARTVRNLYETVVQRAAVRFSQGNQNVDPDLLIASDLNLSDEQMKDILSL